MVVILVILHQHSLAGSIMELLDLDWYSRLLGVKFALLSHSDLLCFGLPWISTCNRNVLCYIVRRR